MNILSEVEELKKIFSIKNITFVSNNILRRFVLDKKNMTPTILSAPNIVVNDTNGKTFDENDMISYQITKFLSTMYNNLSQDNIRILNNNLRNLTVHGHNPVVCIIRNFCSKIIGENVISGGSYNSVRNSIYRISDQEMKIYHLNSNDLINHCLHHELMHMSSSFYDYKSNVSYRGFYQWNNKGAIGCGINEGTTEYLTQKYFPIETDYKIYPLETNVVKDIETVIGNKNLEKFYFNADLESLIKELSKYSNEQDTIQFILNLDKININKESELTYDIKKYLAELIDQKSKYNIQENIEYHR